MNASTRSTLNAVLQGVAWILFAIAGIAFWVGGRAISEFSKADRTLAEMIGIGGALVCAGLGFWLKSVGDGLDDNEE